MDKDDEMILMLVEAVRERPILYSSLAALNSNRAGYVKAWQDVADAMNKGVTADICKRRWKVIRKCHVKFLRNGIEMKTPGIHERLRFLDSLIQAKQDQYTNRSSSQDRLKFNLNLVKLVEEYPFLYDDQPRCISRDREAWNKIANALSDKLTSTDVKKCWQKLRKKYVYFLQHALQDNPKRIESHMHFLKPYMKHIIITNPPRKPARMSHLPIVPKSSRIESYDHLGYDLEDKDAVFLLSIVPHLKAMTGNQRRQFKMSAIMLSAEILKK
uniref:Putative alcohol dehydrogenase transcription factor myb/sant-like protein n=1 Tax=Culex tarsalis TaxID=7177 RepID=A0A1Q3FD76_CULTA